MIDSDPTVVDFDLVKVIFHSTVADADPTVADFDLAKVIFPSTVADADPIVVNFDLTKVNFRSTLADSNPTMVDTDFAKVNSDLTKVNLESTAVSFFQPYTIIWVFDAVKQHSQKKVGQKDFRPSPKNDPFSFGFVAAAYRAAS